MSSTHWASVLKRTPDVMYIVLLTVALVHYDLVAFLFLGGMGLSDFVSFAMHVGAQQMYPSLRIAKGLCRGGLFPELQVLPSRVMQMIGFLVMGLLLLRERKSAEPPRHVKLIATIVWVLVLTGAYVGVGCGTLKSAFSGTVVGLGISFVYSSVIRKFFVDAPGTST